MKMLHKKHTVLKRLLFPSLTILAFISVIGASFFVANPVVVKADHDTCFTDGGSADSASRCTEARKNAAIQACSAHTSTSANDACVASATEHYKQAATPTPGGPGTPGGTPGTGTTGGGGGAAAPPGTPNPSSTQNTTKRPATTTEITPLHEDLKPDCTSGDLSKGCKITEHLLKFINILSAVVGITCIVMITYWGIQYTISRDNAQMVSTARLRIMQTVLSLVGYLFLYSFLQWIVPGGVF